MRKINVLLAILTIAPTAVAQTPAPKKVDIVSVTGCLREQGTNNWMVVAATDPMPSSANAPQKSEIPSVPPEGRNQFKLIGVGEFDLPSFRNQTVVVKGLHIKAAPVDRLNITSIVTASASCVAGAPK
jgi:hypothetical protein